MSRIDDRWVRKDKTRTPLYGKGKRWQAVWIEGDTERKRSFAAKDAAKAFLLTKAVDELDGVLGPDRDATLGELWPRYRATKNNVGAGSQQAYDAAWKHHMQGKWAGVRAKDVTTAGVREWIPSLRTIHGESLSAAYEGYLMGVMKALLEHAVEARIITANPMARVRRRKKKQAVRRYLQVHQADALLKAIKPHDDIVLFMLRTGARRGEASAVKVGDLDLRRRRVRISGDIDGDGEEDDTKSGEHRDVPVAGELLVRLRALSKSKPRETLLFPDPDGNPWTRHKWRPVWNKARGATGIADFDTHELRHTAASWAIESGANVKTVQAMLGHADASITLNTYAHLWNDSLDDVVGRVDELVQRERGVVTVFPQSPRNLPEREQTALCRGFRTTHNREVGRSSLPTATEQDPVIRPENPRNDGVFSCLSAPRSVWRA